MLKNIRMLLKENQNDRCFYCGGKSPSQGDHVYAKSLGGKDCISNMVLACSDCNQLKSNHNIEAFRERLSFSKSVLSDHLTFSQYKKLLSCDEIKPVASLVFYWEKASVRTLCSKSQKLNHLSYRDAPYNQFYSNSVFTAKTPDLKQPAKGLLCYLSWGEQNKNSIAAIANDMCMSKRAVINNLKDLENKHYIEVKKGGVFGGENVTNQYIVNLRKLGHIKH